MQFKRRLVTSFLAKHKMDPGPGCDPLSALKDLKAFENMTKNLSRRYELGRDQSFEKEAKDAKKYKVDDVLVQNLADPSASDGAGFMAPSILKKLEQKRVENAEVEEAMLAEARKASEDQELKKKEKAAKVKEEAASSKSVPLLRIVLNNTIQGIKGRLETKIAGLEQNVSVLKQEGELKCVELNE